VAIAFDAQTRFPATDTTGFHTTSGGTLSGTHTPVGTPSGVVAVVFNNATANPVSTITYGGVTMNLVTSASDTTEVGSVYIYELLSSVPSGAQTFSLTRTATTTNMWVTVTTMTVAGGKVVAREASQFKNTTTSANPTITLTTGVTTFVVGGMHGGAAAPTSYAPGTNYSTQFSADYGALSARSQRSTTTIASGSPVYNFTYATSDDHCLCAAAYKEADPVTSSIFDFTNQNMLIQQQAINRASRW
jgi:hypothetical protein